LIWQQNTFKDLILENQRQNLVVFLEYKKGSKYAAWDLDYSLFCLMAKLLKKVTYS
jgi:hypothetical protein